MFQPFLVRFGKANPRAIEPFLLVGFLGLLTLGSVLLLGPRVRFGRSITWKGVIVEFPRPVVCCAGLSLAELSCVPAGKALWDLLPDVQMFVIQVTERLPQATEGQLLEEFFKWLEPKANVNVARTACLEEGPGPDPEKEPRRLWSRMVLERQDKQQRLAHDKIVIAGKSFLVTIDALLSPPWSEDEIVVLTRSIRSVAK